MTVDVVNSQNEKIGSVDLREHHTMTAMRRAAREARVVVRRDVLDSNIAVHEVGPIRGADVDVFGEMTKAIEDAGGFQQPLQVNFRSQKPLIDTLTKYSAKGI